MDLFSQNNIKSKYKCFEPFLQKEYKGTYYVYYFDHLKATRTKKSTKSKTQREAEKFLKQFRKSIFLGTKDEKIKYLNELLDKILFYYKHSHSLKTIELYKTSITKFIAVNGNIPLNQVTLRGIEFFKIRIAETRSKTTANIYLRNLKSAFYFAMNYGFIYENPFIGIKQFKIEDKEKLSFEPEDMTLILNIIKEPFLKRIVSFAATTGARLGEILNLQWKDIRVSKKCIHIGNKEDFLTKTRKERNIPLLPFSSIINEDPYKECEWNKYRQQNICFEGENVIEFNNKNDLKYVFGKYDGSKFANNYISKLFKKYLREANFNEKYHFHCLRHTAITNMAMKGVPPFIIQVIVGHKDIKTTQSYVHPSLNDMENWLNSIDYSELGIVSN